MEQIIKNRRLAISLLSLLGISIATGAKASTKPDSKGGLQATNVEITGIVVPMARGKKLVNYCFMAINVHCVDEPSATLVRLNSFLIKDAIVKATSKWPYQVGNPPNSFDAAGFGRAVFGVINGVIPGTKISAVEVLDPQLMRK